MINYKDSLAYNYPDIAKMIAIPENDLTFDDCYGIACQSNKKFYFKCLDCSRVSTYKKNLNNIVRKRYSCQFCSDGISIPNKFMSNILKQLNEDFITELSSKEFSGKNYFRYDFYLPKYNMIIELNGLQHYEENTNFKYSLFEQQMNDLFKYKCAKNHVDNYIVIDCRHSELEWMKENIIKELSNYFNFNNIDWELVWKQSQTSKCIETWELWNNGMHSIVTISKELNIHRDTIRKYLKQGAKYGICNYDDKNNNYKKVICVTTGLVFNKSIEASKFYNINYTHISSCCKGKRNYCGKLEDGTKLVWMYYEDYLKQKEEIDEI